MRAAQQERLTKLFWLIQNERDPDAFLKLVNELVVLLDSVHDELELTRENAMKAKWAS